MAAADSLVHQKTGMCFFGHTYLPVVFIRDTVVRGGTYTRFKVEPGKQYLVNPGAVGQPRDHNPKAAYVVYDVDQGMVEVRRSAYDFATTQRKIREAGFGTA